MITPSILSSKRLNRKKTPKLNTAFFLDDICEDITSPSVESNSTGRPSTNSVKSKLRRSLASLRSLLSMDQKRSDISNNGIGQPFPQLDSARNSPGVCFLHENDSSATTVIKPTGSKLSVYKPGDPDPGQLPHSTPISPVGADRDIEPLLGELSSRLDSSLRKSQSTPKLHRRLSQKFLQTFGNPTVIRRQELQSRPSIQELYDVSQKSWWHLQTPLPSTYTSGSSSSPAKTYYSTPLTSDSLNSPTTVLRQECFISPYTALHTRLRSECSHPRRLTPIPEVNFLNQLSIVTVEATATAKTFFETHFNVIFNGFEPREVRLRELKLKLRHLNLEPALQLKVIEAWKSDESNRLRYERQLGPHKTTHSIPNSVSVSGYDIIQVLGKGSFGVVRLVKEKETGSDIDDSDPAKSNGSVSRRLSRADLATLRTAAKGPLALIANRRRQLDPVTKRVFAMKVIRKSTMLKNGQEGHLKAERDFLVGAEGSRWIIPLLSAFQDHRYLYLVMDFCIGGDFLGLLIRKNTLSEENTQFYIAEMILCVEEAHRMRWIHRDVKPDNFLIGADGHLKISDFGLAFDGEWEHDQKFYNRHRNELLEKLGIDLKGDDQDQREDEQTEANERLGKVITAHSKKAARKKSFSKEEPLVGEPVINFRNRAQRRRMAKSVVGTSQYMAPEVIRGDYYDGRCDWWSIGVIMYECLYGFTPFACEDRYNTKMKILRHESSLVFPAVPPILQPSWNALDLMVQLLTEPSKRLCSRRYAMNDYTREVINGRPVTSEANKANRNYAGYFVYPDDADELKRHPFFEGIE